MYIYCYLKLTISDYQAKRCKKHTTGHVCDGLSAHSRTVERIEGEVQGSRTVERVEGEVQGSEQPKAGVATVRGRVTTDRYHRMWTLVVVLVQMVKRGYCNGITCPCCKYEEQYQKLLVLQKLFSKKVYVLKTFLFS